MSFPAFTPVIGEFSQANPAGEGEKIRQAVNALVVMGQAYGENALLMGQPVVAQATTTTKAKTTALTGVYRNKGKPVASIAATDNFWTLSGAVVPISSFQKYLLCVDSAAAAQFVACTPSTVSLAAVSIPAAGIPDGYTILGVLSVSTNSAATFTPGTTNLATAGGVTIAFQDGFDTAIVAASLVKTLERPLL